MWIIGVFWESFLTLDVYMPEDRTYEWLLITMIFATFVWSFQELFWHKGNSDACKLREDFTLLWMSHQCEIIHSCIVISYNAWFQWIYWWYLTVDSLNRILFWLTFNSWCLFLRGGSYFLWNYINSFGQPVFWTYRETDWILCFRPKPSRFLKNSVSRKNRTETAGGNYRSLRWTKGGSLHRTVCIHSIHFMTHERKIDWRIYW